MKIKRISENHFLPNLKSALLFPVWFREFPFSYYRICFCQTAISAGRYCPRSNLCWQSHSKMEFTKEEMRHTVTLFNKTGCDYLQNRTLFFNDPVTQTWLKNQYKYWRLGIDLYTMSIASILADPITRTWLKKSV